MSCKYPSTVLTCFNTNACSTPLPRRGVPALCDQAQRFPCGQADKDTSHLAACGALRIPALKEHLLCASPLLTGRQPGRGGGEWVVAAQRWNVLETPELLYVLQGEFHLIKTENP